jgi:hypothetical protein
MKRASLKAFESLYGFKGPGFTVDTEGNIIAKSISLTQLNEPGTVEDFIVKENNGNFTIDGYAGLNPTITLVRGKTYTFRLELSTIGFNIRYDDSATASSGLIHSSGDLGEDAQDKSTGVLAFTVPLETPDTLNYYDNAVSGDIRIIDATGLFSSIEVTGDVGATSVTSADVTVRGGVGISQNLYVDNIIHAKKINSLGSSLTVTGTGSVIVNAPSVNINNVVNITSSGLSGQIDSAIITNSTIDSTPIGSTTPSTAAFTAASVSEVTGVNSVTNKRYVDETSTAFAIAFGL